MFDADTLISDIENSKKHMVVFNMYCEHGNMGANGVLDNVSVIKTPSSVIISSANGSEESIILSTVCDCDFERNTELNYYDIKYATGLGFSLALI